MEFYTVIDRKTDCILSEVIHFEEDDQVVVKNKLNIEIFNSLKKFMQKYNTEDYIVFKEGIEELFEC